MLDQNLGNDNKENVNFSEDETQEQLSDLQIQIINLLKSYEENPTLSFSGIKRVIGVHQQKLSRALSGLVEENLISKDNWGYSLRAGLGYIPAESYFSGDREGFPSPKEVWRSTVPPTCSITRIMSQFLGRWFGGFRYLSSAFDNKKSRTVVRWLKEDSKAQITVHMTPKEVSVEFFGIYTDDDRSKTINFFENAFGNEGYHVVFDPVYDN